MIITRRLHLKKAERGDQDAQYRLGDCYFEGTGVPEDKTEAFKWYHKAAEQGHVQAQYRLGDCYYFGTGVPENNNEAVKWFRKAAEQGLATSQLALGNLSKTETERRKWYKKIIERSEIVSNENFI